MLEIKSRDGLGRICEFETPHGLIETPAIMPVVNPNIDLISPKELQDRFGAQIFITNSYIFYKDQALKEEVLAKGLHSFFDYSGPIMTDSGTFQNFVYGDIDVEPQEILGFQKDIGSDISTILDLFTTPDDSEEGCREKAERTVKRAERGMKKFRDKNGFIALPVQGGVYPGIRKKCAERLSELKGNIFPIGGVVPLLEDYRFSELVKVIISSKRGLPPEGLVHLFGAGHPMIYPLAVLLGCDLFDSSSYAKYARRGDMMYPSGTKNIDDIEYFSCSCPICSEHEPSELRDISKKERERLIAEHNLWISFKEMYRIKQAIAEKRLWELVERRARDHPYLLEAVRSLVHHWRYLEYHEPRSRKGAVFYTGGTTLNRPCIKRIQEWIEEDYDLPTKGPTVFFQVDEKKKPYGRYLKDELGMLLPDHQVNLLCSTPMGPVPLEMDEVYPIAQSIFPEHLSDAGSVMDYLDYKDIQEIIIWEGEGTLENLDKRESKGLSLEEMRLRTVSDYQFTSGAGDVFANGELEFVKNRKGRIRNVHLNDGHILSMRHYDGLFTLKKEGGNLLKEASDPPTLRVTVTDESAEFNAEGKSVFAKFVIDADDEIRPGDEVLVVDNDDNLVAVGRALMTKNEMFSFGKGVAVKIREGFEYIR